MKSFGSVLFAAAVLGAAQAAQSGSQTPSKNGSAETADCVTHFSILREQAGLDAFVAEQDATKKMPIGKQDYVNAICSAINNETPLSQTPAEYKRDGTYAYAPQTGTDGACKAAARFWKKAYSNFEGVPPVYKSDQEAPYADSQNRSLVALYNTKENATIDCAYITCPAPATSTTTAATTTVSTTPASSAPTVADPNTQSPTQNQGNARRLSEVPDTVTHLVCLTNPPALVVNEKPFSDDAWDRIKTAIENSASATTQSALLAAALLLLTSFTFF